MKTFNKIVFQAIIGLCLLLFPAGKNLGQSLFIESGLNMNPNPFIYSWDQQTDFLQVSIYAETENPIQVKILGEILDGFGNRIGWNDPAYAPSFSVGSGETYLQGNQALSFGSFEFDESIRRSLFKTRMLPQGDYQLCLQLVNAADLNPLTEFPSCSYFTISGLEAPYLLSPANYSIVSQDELIHLIFQWTPLTLFEPSGIWFEQNLVIAEILPGQNPELAIRVNTPVISSCVGPEANDYLYHEDMISLPNGQYAWSVCIRDQCDGEIIALYSQVFVLVVSEETEETDTLVLDPTFPEDFYFMAPGNCSSPIKKPEKGSEISLGMVLEKADLFAYPRAVPLRAEGIDIDLVKMLCAGCEGTESSMSFTVKDDVNQFHWRLLDGKGTLNTPADLTELQNLQEQIDQLEQDIRNKEAAVDSVKNEADNKIPDKITRLKNKIEEAQRLKDEAEEQKGDEEENNRNIVDSIALNQTDLNIFRDSIRILSDEIGLHQDKVDSLQNLLNGAPSDEEIAQRIKVGDFRTSLNDLRDQLINKDQQIANESNRLTGAIGTAENNLETAVGNFQKTSDLAAQFSQAINSLQTELMKDPDYRELVKREEDYGRKTTQFIRQYAEGVTHQNRLTDLRSVLKQNKVALTTSNPAIRNSVYQQAIRNSDRFSSEIAGICSNPYGETPQFCQAGLTTVQDSKFLYQTTLSSLINSGFKLDSTILLQIDSLTIVLQSYEWDLSRLEGLVDDANSKYEDALADLASTLESLAREKQTILGNIQSTEENLAREEGTLAIMEDKRKQDLDLNREFYLETIHSLQSDITSKSSLSGYYINKLTAAIQDSISFDFRKQQSDKEIEDLDKRISQLAKAIEITQNAISDAETKITELNEEIKQKQEDIEEDQQKLDELKKKLEDLGKKPGSKEANGPLVYYLPPPLEEIFTADQQDSFEALKDSVRNKEKELNKASGNKAKRQGELVKLLNSAAKELVTYKLADEKIAELEEKISDLDKEIGQNKATKAAEYLDEQVEVGETINEKQTESVQLGTRIDSLHTQTDEIKDDLKSLRDSIKLYEERREIKEDTVLSIHNRLEAAEADFRTADADLRKANDDLAGAQTLIRRLQKELGMSQDNLTRAYATEDETEISKLVSKTEGLEKAIKDARDEITQTLQPAVNTAKTDLNRAKIKVAATNEQYLEEQNEWRAICRKIDYGLTPDLEEKNNELEKNLSDVSRTEKMKANAEEHLAKAEERKEELKTAVEDDEDIKKQSGELEELKQEKGKEEEKKAKAETAVKDILEEKDELIKSTDEALKKAQEELEKAQKELRDFLLDAFNHVDFKIRLELKGKDAVLDEWRAEDEDPAPLIKTLEYPKDRVPRFIGGNTFAEEKYPEDENIVSNCVPTWLFEKEDPPEKITTTLVDQNEPRTIALLYRNGKPLWPEWPVIPSGTPLLAKDVVRVLTEFTDDHDQIFAQCVTDKNCECDPEVNAGILDKKSYLFAAVGQVISHHPLQNIMFWETDLVKKPRKIDKEKIEPTCLAKELAEDDDVSQIYEPLVQAGIMIEVTEELVGVPDTTLEIQGRIVTGDHKGLSSEKIHFEAELKKGESEGWGFNGGNPSVDVNTDGEGYSKTQFAFGDGFAEFEIKVQWIRGDQVLEEKTLEAKAPLILNFHRFGNSSPDFAWEAALKLFEKGGTVSSAVAEFPAGSDEKGEEAYATAVQGVSGLLDNENDFVNGEKTLFEMLEDDASCDPDEDETKVYGLGVTWIELPEQEEDEEKSFTLKTKVEAKYEEMADPSEKEKAYSTAKAERFYIGPEELPFMIVMDETFSPHDPVSGSGRLGLEEGDFCDPILEFIYEIPLEVDGIELSGEEDHLVAVSGSITYEFTPAMEKSMGPFTFEFEKLTITANGAAGLSGKVKHETYFEEPISFEVSLDPMGNFMGSLSDLPEFEVKGFTLKEGTAFTLDFSNSESPSDLSAKFKGIFISQISLEMPESFSSTEGEKPKLNGSNLYIGKKEGPEGSSWLFGGGISYEGTLMKLGYAGYELTASNVSLEFKDGDVKKLEITGELTLGDPMSGSIGVTITGSEEKFAAEVKTDNPVSIPRLGMVMTLHKGCAVTWIPEENLGKLTLNSRVVSQKFGTVDIEGFEINSKGEIKTEAITMDQPIEFGSGFNLHIKKLGFAVTADEYSMNVDGNFSFPKIGLDNLEGSVSLKPGPTIDVTFKSAKIEFEKGPVDFSGELNFSSTEFRGDFEIGIKNVFTGIKALLIVGNTPDENEVIYNYWYSEIEIGTEIPLGQSGLSLLSLGGGLGYNYNPPIGNQDGAPSHSEAFSFKAMLSMGTNPGGKLMKGRMEMVYTQSYFSLYGKAWLLQMEDALFGEGQLNLWWQPNSKVDGYIRMYVGLPDAEGSVVKFDGKINFEFISAEQFYVKSETLKGSILGVVNAEGKLNITPEQIYMHGEVGYELNESYDLAVVTAIIEADFGADGTFEYRVDPMYLDITGNMHAYWDFDLETPLGTADITSGNLQLNAQIHADQNETFVWVKVPIEYDVWVYSGKENIEFKIEF